MAARKRTKKPFESKTKEEIIEEAVVRCSMGDDRSYFRALFRQIVDSNSLPLEVFETVPSRALPAGKTRFDQVFDAMMHVAFPSYREETVGRLLGPGAPTGPDVKIWRVIIPPRFKVSHVLIRAASLQEAFALGCDYACRMSVRLFGQIPADLTVRIQFMSERAIRRMLRLRWANRVHKRKTLQFVGRVFTKKEVAGAKSWALGHPDQRLYSVARYADARDLKRLLMKRDIIRISSVEHEVLIGQDDDDIPSGE